MKLGGLNLKATFGEVTCFIEVILPVDITKVISLFNFDLVKFIACKLITVFFEKNIFFCSLKMCHSGLVCKERFLKSVNYFSHCFLLSCTIQILFFSFNDLCTYLCKSFKRKKYYRHQKSKPQNDHSYLSFVVFFKNWNPTTLLSVFFSLKDHFIPANFK